VIGAIGVLRDMRELEKERAYAESLIENAPDPVFVSDLEGKILQANDAVSELLGFRKDEVLEQSLSRFISPEETQEFTAALREVVEHGVTRDAVLTRAAPPARSSRQPQRLRASRFGGQRDRRDRRAPRHARVGEGARLRGEPDRERARPVFVSDLEGRSSRPTTRSPSCSASARTRSSSSRSRASSVRGTQEFTAAVRGSSSAASPETRASTPQRLGRDHPDDAERVRAPRLRRESNCAIGILRDMRAYEEVVQDLEQSKTELQEKIPTSRSFEGSSSAGS